MDNAAFENEKSDFAEFGDTKINNVENSQSVTFEDALILTGHGKFHIHLLIACGLCMMGVITETLGMSFILPALQCDFDLTLGDKGILSAIAFLGLVASSHFWGFLADTQGRRVVIRWSLILSCIVSTLSSFSHVLWLFIFLRFWTGFLVSGVSATAYAYLGEFNSDKTRAKSISWAAAFISLGTIALPAVAWPVIPMTWGLYLPGLGIYYSSWRLYVVLCAIPNTCALLLLCFLPESAKFLLARGQPEQSLKVLKEVYRRNKGKNAEEYPVKELKSDGITGNLEKAGNPKEIAKLMWSQTAPLFKKPLLLCTLMCCFLQFGIFAASSGFFLWFPEIVNKIVEYNNNSGGNAAVCDVIAAAPLSTFLKAISRSNPDDPDDEVLECSAIVNPSIYKITLILGAVFSVVYIIIGLIINIVGKKNVLLVSLLTTGVCGICVNWATSYYLILGLFGAFLASGVCAGVMNAVIVDLFPTHLRAMALCITLMIGRLGAVAGSNLVGYLLEYTCPTSFFLFGGLLVACGLTTIFLPNTMPTLKTEEAPPTQT